MKKFSCVVAVLALCAAPAFAETLNLRLVTDGDADTASPASYPATVNVYLQAELVDGTTGGLALLGVNMVADTAFDLCDTAQFLMTADLTEFDRNDGLTNPAGLGDPGITGFSGTCDGSGGLWQIGGGQNTIGNTGPTAYPTGLVTTDVGNSGWVTFASGTIDADGDMVLSLNTAFANTIDDAMQGSPYDVSEVATIAIVGDLTIGGAVMCADHDVDCNGSTNAGDILVVRSGLNWNQAVGSAADPRCDVDGNGTCNAGDILVIRSGLNWNTSTGPCVCP